MPLPAGVPPTSPHPLVCFYEMVTERTTCLESASSMDKNDHMPVLYELFCGKTINMRLMPLNWQPHWTDKRHFSIKPPLTGLVSVHLGQTCFGRGGQTSPPRLSKPGVAQPGCSQIVVPISGVEHSLIGSWFTPLTTPKEPVTFRI